MPSKGEKNTTETKKKISETLHNLYQNKESHPMFGKHHSEETKKKIGDTKQNISEETRERMRLSQLGKHSGERNPMFGKTHSEEARDKMRKANLGKPSSFKGKHHSEESRKHMSEGHKGKLSGERNPYYGKTGIDHPCFGLKKSEESRKKISETRKYKIAIGEIKINKKCGKDNPMFGTKGKNHPFYGKKHSDETKNIIRIKNGGSNNHNWKGGTSYGPYCEKFNKQRKEAVRNFFDGLCLCCGEYQYKRKHQVHHIDHDKEQGCNGKPFNLIPMCQKCHGKELHNEEEYKAYINKTLREGFKWGIWNEQEYIEKVMY
jgi:hypothetical protein